MVYPFSPGGSLRDSLVAVENPVVSACQLIPGVRQVRAPFHPSLIC
jgi:hypothetical protein